MITSLKSSIYNNLKNIPGWRINKKIIIFESDDWGSIRMPSKKAYDKLSMLGIDLISGDSERYNRYDSLATQDDLSSLFEILTSVKDVKGNNVKFTVISLVANPVFEKIKEAYFNEYFYEPFTETLKKYPGCESSFDLWKEGISNRIFIPQFHGREHLNVLHWMKALQNNDSDTLNAFNEKLWGFICRSKLLSYQAAFDIDDLNEIEYQIKVIEEGLKLFEQIHGYKATFFVPPNGPFNNQLEKTAADNGIKFMSSSKIQLEPIGNGKTRKVFHCLGQKNKHGQHYLTRNCFFEPSQKGKDWVDNCLRDIEYAFRWKKPAVISTHRVNYIGALDERNRTNGKKQLTKLLSGMLKKWPDIEFMTSNELGDLIVKR